MLVTIDTRTEEIKGLQRATIQLLNEHANSLRACIQVCAQWCTYSPAGPMDESHTFSRVAYRLRLTTTSQLLS